MMSMTYYSQVLIEVLSIKDYDDLINRISCNDIHVGMFIRLGDIITVNTYETVRLTQHQLDWLIYELKELKGNTNI